MIKRKGRCSQKGITIFEMVLVLAVATTFLIVGLNVYKSFQQTLQIQQVQDNVEQLFQATADYYAANCEAGDFAPQPQNFLSPYTSSAGITYPPSNPFGVGISSTLLANGYLTDWNPTNPLVDASGGESGYLVQLNPVVSATNLTVNACVILQPGTACTPVSADSIQTGQAQVVTWAIQVSVKMQGQTTPTQYLGALGADCASQDTGDSPDTVNTCASEMQIVGFCEGCTMVMGAPVCSPCTASPGEIVVGNLIYKIVSQGPYLVWQRSPSYATIGKRPSPMASSIIRIRQLKLQYTHDMYNEYNQGYTTTGSPTQAPVYYTCGG